MLAADWVNEIGLKLGKLSAPSAAALKPMLPDVASVSDLIDTMHDARPLAPMATDAMIPMPAIIRSRVTLAMSMPFLDVTRRRSRDHRKAPWKGSS